MPPTSGAGATGGEEPSAAAQTGFIDLLSPPVRERCRIRRFAPGDVVVHEGEAGGNAFILVSGRCEVTVHGETLNLIHPGELFGEIACLEAGTRTATVRAAVESEVLELEGDSLRSELQRSPAMLEKCLRMIAHRVRDISRRETTMRDEQRGLRKSLESLQPRLERFKDHPVLTVEVHWQPMSFASGDYYDVLELSPDRLLFALGDVMGHGAPTTPIVGMMRGQLHEIASSGQSASRGAGASAPAHTAPRSAERLHDPDAADRWISVR